MKKSTSKAAPTGSSAKISDIRGRKEDKNFDISLIKEFTDFMRVNDLVEIDMKLGKRALRLRRAEGSAPIGASPASAAPHTVAPAAASEPTPALGRKYHIVTSPFVGTFYRSAGPNQDSFVEEGQAVGVGDTLCIVEAMKLMNEIESDMKGRVVKVLVNNSTPVEFGEALFEIDPL